jgi:flavodoxin
MKKSRFLKIILFISFLGIFTGCQNPTNNIDQNKKQSEVNKTQDMDTNEKTLVVYFSQTGTTKRLAEYAADILNADIYEIIAAEPYTKEDLAYYTNGRADQEQSDPSVRPQISGEIKNMEEYDRIILGYPIWHSQAPKIIITFLEKYDFSKKTIIPFCTSHSSGIGSSASHLHEYTAPTTTWLEGKRFGGETSKKEIEEFLNGIID